MQKICECCLEIYKGSEPITYCPKRNCPNDLKLVESDDMLVDVLIGFWKAGIETLFSCAGHLYNQHSFPFHPHITFFTYQPEGFEDKAGIDGLKNLRDILETLNEDDDFDIGNIQYSENHDGYCLDLTCNIPDRSNLTARNKLEIQNDFLNFLYDVLDAVQEEGVRGVLDQNNLYDISDFHKKTIH